MQYELLPKQEEFLNIPHKYGLDVALYQGGFGAGKTWSGSLLGILLALKYDGIKGLVGAQNFPLVRDTTMAEYFNHLDRMGLVRDTHYTFNKAESLLTFMNGSVIMFRHLEEPEKLKSLSLGFVEIEEMSDTSESTFKMFLGRMRQEKKAQWGDDFQYRIFGHTNPEQAKGWIYKYFVEQPQPNYRLIKAPSTQNKFLGAEYVENMRNAFDSEYYRINVLGEFGDYTSGLVVKGFDYGKNVKECNYVDDIPLHFTFDFNLNPFMMCIAHIDWVNKNVYYIDELVIENTHTREVMKELVRRYPNHKDRIVINGDASGQFGSTQSEIHNYAIIEHELEKAGYTGRIDLDIKSHNPPIQSRINAFNARICNSNGERKVFVNPKCEKLLYNINNLKYKTGTTILDLPTHSQLRNDRNSLFLGHIFDAASYLVDFYFPITDLRYCEKD